MLFNSFGYLCLFLPIAVGGTWLLRMYAGARAAQAGILVLSAVFYGWWHPWNLLHLGASIFVNWGLASRMAASEQPYRKRWLQLGLILNLGYLCSYKYLAFFLGMLRCKACQGDVISVAIPLGISFFTITQIMYLVDTYEGAVSAGNLFEHATFISFFPYVLSGPLAKAKRMRRQLSGSQDAKPIAASLARGLYLFSLGLFKKSVCAEAFAQVATYGFDTARHRSSVEVMAYSICYSMQIYFDFSGYSDMAIGSAEMLGIEIPRNFDAPFRSRSIIEFWERWHISLSSFIATYMYTPLLRSFQRATLPMAMLSTFLVMSVVGLWHGAAWTFVLFGMLHGMALAVNSLWRKRFRVCLPAWLSWGLTFLFVDMAFVLFRSNTVREAAGMWVEVLGGHGLWHLRNLTAMRANFSLPIFGPAILLGLAAAFWGKSSEQRAREFQASWATVTVSACALLVAAIYTNSQLSPGFIYFKF